MRFGQFVFVWTPAICLLLGCAKSSDQTNGNSPHRLVGQWHGVIQINDSEQSNELNDEQLAAIKRMNMDIDFRHDGSLQLSASNFGRPYSSGGHWELLNETGNAVTFVSSETQGNTKEITVLFDGNNSFSMPLPEPISRLGAMRFERVLR